MSTQTHGGEALARAVQRAYGYGQTDYYLEPLVRVDGQGKPVGKINPGDAVVFCCRRGEREIELTEMFTDPTFEKVPRAFLPDLDFAILTLYHDKFKHLPVAFAPERVQKPLAQIVSEAGRAQLHCAESEKFAHVTFFFNGGCSAPFPGEDDVCVPSPKNIPFEQVPELSLPAVTDAVIARLGAPEFVVVNFANGDVIGHTASREAKLTAAKCVSRELERLTRAAIAKDYVVLVTADHGNIEALQTPSGQPHVAHTANRVPCLLLDGREKGGISPRNGALCDVAPTVLHAMGIAQPAEMTGQSLVMGHDFGGARKTLLVILDGWGVGSGDDHDAIFLADTPYWDELIKTRPCALLEAAGEAVGLGAGKAGNSEAGHMNLGAGRVVAQDDQRLDRAMADGSFAQNPVFARVTESALKRGAALHLIAYLTRASSHGSIEYPLALCRLAREKGLSKVYLHMVFDGRSTPPGSAPALLRELDAALEDIGTGEIADGAGRAFVLDRDGNYDKVKRAYDAMTQGVGTPCV